jgi:para-nitrobenzyl esterase
MYLIEGRDRALLFDTGMGRGDLAGFVRSLTKLPVDVAITHGNRDHFLQVDQFPESTVYMSHKDVTRLPPELVTPRYRWVKDGDRLDLGGRSFSVIEVAGHSLGSVVYLDEANRIAMTGDAISSGSMVYVFAPTCTALDQYLASLRGLEDRVRHLDGLTLLVGHHYQERTPLTGAAGRQLITDMRTAAERVLRGELEGRPAQTVRDGRPVDLRQANVGLAGLWYNPKNLVTDPAALGLLEVRTVAGAPVIPSPIFSSFQTTYTAKVPAAVTRLELVPTAYDPAHRAITVNGTRVPSGGRHAAPVRPGPNRFDLVVTAERGTSRTYTLVVTRDAAGSQ